MLRPNRARPISRAVGELAASGPSPLSSTKTTRLPARARGGRRRGALAPASRLANLKASERFPITRRHEAARRIYGGLFAFGEQRF